MKIKEFFVIRSYYKGFYGRYINIANVENKAAPIWTDGKLENNTNIDAYTALLKKNTDKNWKARGSSVFKSEMNVLYLLWNCGSFRFPVAKIILYHLTGINSTASIPNIAMTFWV